MTREEAIKELQESHDMMRSYNVDENESRLMTALNMAIQALSQEPTVTSTDEPMTMVYPTIVCDDAISREDAEQMFRNIRSHLKPQDYKSAEEFNTRDLMLLNAEQMIHALPSVTQKSETVTEFADRCRECGAKYGKLLERKSGKWINDKNDIPICSRCGYIPQFDRAIDDYEYSNYCPSCGAKMVESQESEDKG